MARFQTKSFLKAASLAAAVCLLTCCSDKGGILREADRTLDSDPAEALRQLDSIGSDGLSGSLLAYYSLLHTIALDKTDFEFTDDSEIESSCHWYSSHKCDNLQKARATFYKGVVAARMGRSDTLSLRCYKQAEAILEENNISNPRLEALLFSYIGNILYGQTQWDKAAEYLEKAVEQNVISGNVANRCFDLMDAYSCYAAAGRAEDARRCLDSVEAVSNRAGIPEVSNNFYNLRARDCYHNGEYEEALEWCRKWQPEDGNGSHKERLMASVFRKMGENDSALVHETAALNTRKGSDSLYFYLYYKSLAEIHASEGRWREAQEQMTKAYDALYVSMGVQKQQRVLELEKAYNLSRKESELEQVRSRNNLIVAISVLSLVVILLTAALIVMNNLKLKTMLKQEAQIQRDGAMISHIISAAALSQSKGIQMLRTCADKCLADKKELYNQIVDTLSAVKKEQALAFEKIIKEEMEAHPAANSRMLGKLQSTNDKITFYLSEKGFSNKEIAAILGSTPDAVRARKSKIQKDLGIEPS